MKKNSKPSMPLKKIIILSIAIIFLFGIGVLASNTQIRNVKIKYASGEEINVLTTKTIISEILEESKIIVLPEEYVYPEKNSEIGDNKTILISKEEIQQQEVAETQEIATLDKILEEYAPIIEKTIVVQEEIPFETITKDVSGGAAATQNSVITKGVNGIKEVTYQVKYKNDIEIEKKELSSRVIKEPVNKVVQVSVKVTSRSGSRSSVTTYGNGTWSYSAADLDLLCAITAQECSSSYEGALAVITTACNRAVSNRWKSNGADPLSQYMAKGQFCYSIDNHWKKRLNGNYASYVKQAVLDALNGKRNHSYLSFRAAGTASGENIGGNVYFNHM